MKPSAAAGCRSDKRNSRISAVAVLAWLVWAAAPCSQALASFHFMQIEKIVGGVNGDTTAQAIQLRMRTPAQEQLNRGKIVAYDAAGENPVVIVDFQSPVPVDAAGSRILVTSQAMTAYSDPPVDQDFLMEALIPESYLAAGSIIFENDEETLIVWRVSWGGAAYTGDTVGSLTNDDDREFGPPFAGPLPTSELQVLEFPGTNDAKSTSNLADYQLSDGPGDLTNNAGASFALIVPDCNDPNGAGPDSDNDSVRDVCDECPSDGAKTQPGICGCGVSDVDSDADGTPDCHDSDHGGGPSGNGNDNGSGGNDNENANENENTNDNVPTGGGNDNVGNDNQPSGNSNDNSAGNGSGGNDNGNNANDGGGTSPRGCTSGIGVVLTVMLGLSGLRLLEERRRVRRSADNKSTGGRRSWLGR